MALANKYRAIYSTSSFRDGFRVKGAQAEQASLLRDVLSLYWHINRDHAALERDALASGRWVAPPQDDAPAPPSDLLPSDYGGDELEEPPAGEPKVWSRRSFAVLPVNSFKRRHVRICNDVFACKLYKALFDMNVKGLEKHAFVSLFNRTSKGRQNVECLRSASEGWSLGRSFVTDGTSMCLLYENAQRGETTAEKRAREDNSIALDQFVAVFIAKDRKLGIDPGRTNIATTCERVAGGRLEFKKLTRDRYYSAGGLDDLRKRRERRHALYADAQAAVSATRRRTANGAEFARYVTAVNANKADLAKAFACRSACSEAFEAYSGRHRALDGFLSGLGTHPEDGTLYIGLGAAKFNSTGRGERAVPTTAVRHRMETAFKARMKVLLVDEYHTTKCSCRAPHEVLGKPTRRLPGGRIITDRDVRFCSSEPTLGSHPCPPPPELTEGLRLPASAEWVDRDGNSAHAMMDLMGLRHDERPPAFQRPRT